MPKYRHKGYITMELCLFGVFPQKKFTFHKNQTYKMFSYGIILISDLTIVLLSQTENYS